jgi:putative protease
MPYQVVCDGQLQDLGKIQYLLSPQDLAAFDLVPRLVELGVASLKIEGRLKTSEYVANITRQYRRAVDAACEGRAAAFTADDVREMELSFSRGFSHGFLDGNNHKVLVRGDRAKKRGVYLGSVAAVTRTGVRLELSVPVKKGDGVVLDGDEALGLPEQGGRVYDVVGPASRGEPTVVELRFGQRDVDLRRIEPGQGVWKTDDPELTRRLRRTFEGAPQRTVALDLHVTALVGAPLRVAGRTETGFAAEVGAEAPLQRAEHLAADDGLLRDQLGRLGGTAYRLRALSAEIAGGPLVPKSLLNVLRRELVARLDEAAERSCPGPLAEGPVLPGLLPASPGEPGERAEPILSVLCRTAAQVEAAIGAGIRTLYLDYQDIKDYGASVGLAHRNGVKVFIATPRIEKPGEENLFRYLIKQRADGLLVRNAGGLYACAAAGVPFVADFALNAANALSVAVFKERGALRVTASYDLSADQLHDLLASVPPGWLEIVVHQQIPMFHMEHCVFCAFLSPGTDRTNCGRPCDVHDVKLRDRVGKEHPLKADVGCRNTLYNAVPQTAAESLPRLLARGARHLRVEFLDDGPESVERTIRLYTDAMAGRRDAATLWRELKAMNQYGVTRGALAVLQGA